MISELFCKLLILAGRTQRLQQKDKALLFLMEKPLSPCHLMDLLNMKASNVTTMMDSLRDEYYLSKFYLPHDRRLVEYRLLKKGIDYVNSMYANLEKEFANFLTSETEYDSAYEKISDVIKLISFMR